MTVFLAHIVLIPITGCGINPVIDTPRRSCVGGFPTNILSKFFYYLFVVVVVFLIWYLLVVD